MPYRVVTWGTGNVGSYAVRAVLGHPELELVAHIVSSPEKSGRDVGELIGLEQLAGVLATDNVDEALATRPDCVIYTAHSETRMMEAAAVSGEARAREAGEARLEQGVRGGPRQASCVQGEVGRGRAGRAGGRRGGAAGGGGEASSRKADEAGVGAAASALEAKCRPDGGEGRPARAPRAELADGRRPKACAHWRRTLLVRAQACA